MNRWTLIAKLSFLLIFVFAAFSSAVRGDDEVQQEWVEHEPMPTARWYAAAATGTGPDGIERIYVFGGKTALARGLDKVEAYGPPYGPGGWTTVTPMPTGRFAMVAVRATNGKIYVIGGHDGSNYLDTVEEYDPAADSWRSRKPMPKEGAYLAAGVGLNGRIYVFGGTDPYSESLTTVEYDPVADTWMSRAPMPSRRSHFAAATGCDGLIYVSGGGPDFKSFEVYDPVRDLWLPKPSMPVGLDSHASATGIDGRIYVVGEGASQAFDAQASTDSWESLGRSYPWGMTAASLGDRIYVFGGYSRSGGALAVAHSYGPLARVCSKQCSTPTENTCPTCQSTWEAACTSPGRARAAVTICNNSAGAETYFWSLKGIEAEYGGVCSIHGPTGFKPGSGFVTIEAGSCSTTPVEIDCPAGSEKYTHGCFRLEAVEVKKGHRATCSGSTLISDNWLWSPQDLFLDLPLRMTKKITFKVTSQSSREEELKYRLSVVRTDMVPDEPTASLDGNAPGAPVDGAIRLAPGGTGEVHVNVSFTKPGPITFYDLLVSADPEGSGKEVVLASVGLRSKHADCNRNGRNDTEDISGGSSQDCDRDGSPDECNFLKNPSHDCNRNQMLDVCEVRSGMSPDLDANGSPDSCDIRAVVWNVRGTAQGGQFTTTIRGFYSVCTVTVPTAAGQSASAVAANVTAALNTDPCLFSQGVTASSRGGEITLRGFALRDGVENSTTDLGLSGQLVIASVPTLSEWGFILMALFLLGTAWRFIGRL